MELRLLGLAVGTFTRWPISLAQNSISIKKNTDYILPRMWAEQGSELSVDMVVNVRVEMFFPGCSFK